MYNYINSSKNMYILQKEKVYKELSEIYGNENLNSAPIKYEDLQQMDYLSRVIKETMRLFPLVACVVRHLKEDLKIGLLISINLYNFFA